MPEAVVRVLEPDRSGSGVQVRPSQQGQSQASQRLVSEMMILAGQAIASIGQHLIASYMHDRCSS